MNDATDPLANILTAAQPDSGGTTTNTGRVQCNLALDD